MKYNRDTMIGEVFLGPVDTKAKGFCLTFEWNRTGRGESWTMFMELIWAESYWVGLHASVWEKQPIPHRENNVNKGTGPQSNSVPDHWHGDSTLLVDREEKNFYKQRHTIFSLKHFLSPMKTLILGSNRFSCFSLPCSFQKVKLELHCVFKNTQVRGEGIAQ